MLINTILKKNTLQKFRIIFCIMMAVIFCFTLQVSADEKNDVKAVRKSAEQGEAWAQHCLGLMYYSGKGVFQDYVTAYAWFDLSSASGHKDANNNRDVLINKMTPQQIAQAQELSVKFQDKIDRAKQEKTDIAEIAIQNYLNLIPTVKQSPKGYL